MIAIHPPLRSRVDRAVTPMPSLDRHLANAAILDCLGRLLLLLLLLVLPLLHMCMRMRMRMRMLLLLLVALIRPPLQGQRTHTSCRMRRSDHTRETKPLGHGSRHREYEKAGKKVKATSYSPPWTPGRSP